MDLVVQKDISDKASKGEGNFCCASDMLLYFKPITLRLELCDTSSYIG